jgi:CRP/FNR family transcriptional regulator, cyclic AMP receptor protein
MRTSAGDWVEVRSKDRFQIPSFQRMPSFKSRLAIATPGRIARIASHNSLTGLPSRCASRLLEGALSINLPERKTLIETGATPDGCYWLEHGLLKGSISTHLGDERIIELLGPGSIVGAISAIDGLPQSVTVQAITQSRLTFVSRRAFSECMHEFPEMQTYVVTAIAAHLRKASDKTTTDSFLPAKVRVARALLQFAEYLKDTAAPPHLLIIRRKFRKNDVAALAHVARENASRILNGWKKANIVAFPSPSVWIIQKEEMEREAQIGG